MVPGVLFWSWLFGWWPKKVLSYMLDIARVNAGTVLALNQGKDPRKINSFHTVWALGTQLCTPLIQVRTNQTNDNI